MKLKFPIGIQSFEVIRTEGYYYVDKTPFVKMLVDEGKYYFLSRPRRFGKSLFIDTLKQAFLGKKELFKDLYLYDNWDWNVTYPVIHISFGSGVVKEKSVLEKKMDYIVSDHAEKYKVCLKKEIISDKFFELIKKLAEKYNQKVVVLVDEYDKPILDNIENPETAIEMREALKNFYSVLKDADPYLKFVFLTGVSKFSKVSIFSGLNNLKDITLHPKYGTICGYTQSELETVFADALEDVNLEEVKLWYNGYNFLSEPVYNPFDILLYLDSKIFRPYWFETGTPTFLIKLIQQKKLLLPSLENLEVGEELLESFDIDKIYPETLLFQTGYLTIKSVKRKRFTTKYTLTWPNFEVKVSFNNHLLNEFMELSEKEKKLDAGWDALEQANLDALKNTLYSLFASIPYDWYRKNNISEYEGFYASVVYAYFSALGVDVRVEDATNVGRLDMAVIFENKCYIFEFKVIELDESKGKALSQLKEKRYHEKYLNQCKEVYLIGIEFSKEKRNITNFEWEKI